MLGLSRDVVNGIPILGPAYTGAVDAVTTRLAGMMTGEDPQAIKDRVYGRQDQYEAENPVLSTAGQIAGGVAAMAPLGMTAAGARAFGVAPGQGLFSRVVNGGFTGGAVSGADSLARGNSVQEAAFTGLGGAVLGGAGGAAAPHIGAAFSKAGEAGRRALGMAPSAGDVGISRPAADLLTDAMMADGTLGTQAGLNMSQAGPRAMLADAGPNTASLLDTAIQSSGPGSRIATEAIEARASGSYDDIVKALAQNLGEPRGVYTTSQGLRTGTAPARDAAYKAAYSSPIDYSSEAGRNIEQLVTRVPSSAIDAAKKMMQAEGVQSQQMFASIADDGSVIINRMPDVRELDYITRALNKVANSTEGTGAFGKMDDLGRIYSGLARDIRSATKEAAPAYATALETAATPLQQKEALEFGASLLRPSMARDEAADIISGMTGPQRQFAKQGVASDIDEALANVRAVVSDPNLDAREARKALQDLSSRAAREKIALLMDDEAASSALFKKLDEASRSLLLRANTSTNTKTYARTALNDTVRSYVEDGAVNQAKQGKPFNAAQSIVQALTGRDARGKKQIADKIYAEIAQLLTQSPDAGMDLISGLATRRALARNPRVGAALVPGAVSPATQSIAEALRGGR
ncbi:hypothetical protein [Devosia naphthalenivorans]|uniref:hypothetical protein n=1 Tax=Devosia naphthalenivorans TaxID=2082392 RepID=UPI000D3CBA9D|nr:hypothetical protein [Devosia naphthalenivorans]